MNSGMVAEYDRMLVNRYANLQINSKFACINIKRVFIKRIVRQAFFCADKACLANFECLSILFNQNVIKYRRVKE